MEDVEDEYGPGFDADEEAILSRLLTQASTELPLRPAPITREDQHVDDAVRSRRYALRPRRSHGGAGAGVVVAYEAAEPMQDVRDDGHTAQPRNMTRDEVRGDHLVDDATDGVLPDPRKTPGPELPTVDEGDTVRDVDANMIPDDPGTAAARESTPMVDIEEDTRSPLDRFRPRGRPLSVTDLISPAWCEQQWAFVLSKHGRKRTNAAMAAGNRVHRRLEAEVHVRVSVDVESREDAFGLRIWNAIQGLRTLRETGMTRELEVWGLIDGRIVNGVIDELSYVCPDTELEKPQDPNLQQGQMTLNDFFKIQRKAKTSSSNGKTTSQDDTPSSKRLRTLRSMRATTDRVYLCDVKTRANPSVPRGAAFRPTLLQLMLYRYLLGQMASDGEAGADISSITRALRLDADAPFTDTFLAELGRMSSSSSLPSAGDDPISQSSESLLPSQHSSDALDLLLEHATLRQLWDLLRAEYQATFPRGDRSCGDVLKAEYREPDEGNVRGIKTFAYSEPLVSEYIAQVMQWWRGEREPEGVEPAEAYKCRYCDFADECSWRLRMVEEDRVRFREMHGKAAEGEKGKVEKHETKEGEEIEPETQTKWQRTRSQV